MNQYTPIAERLFSRVRHDSETGCWIWTGTIQTNPKTGDKRAKIRYRGHPSTQAYRVAYELTFGPIPEGMLVCHHCDNGVCINPTHLFLGTYQDNALDSLRKGRHSSQVYPELYRRLGRELATRNIGRKQRRPCLISLDDIPEIELRLRRGESLTHIGFAYGVSKQAVTQRITRAALAKAAS